MYIFVVNRSVRLTHDPRLFIPDEYVELLLDLPRRLRKHVCDPRLVELFPTVQRKGDESACRARLVLFLYPRSQQTPGRCTSRTQMP